MKVEEIGRGYYAIITEGVVIDERVSTRVDEAFERAMAVPTDQLLNSPSNNEKPGKAVALGDDDFTCFDYFI